jgi:hypothetical protein
MTVDDGSTGGTQIGDFNPVGLNVLKNDTLALLTDVVTELAGVFVDEFSAHLYSHTLIL